MFEAFDLKGAEALINPVGQKWSRQRRYANIQVRVEVRTLRRFKEWLPMHGGLSWYVRSAIEELANQGRDVTDESHIDYIRGRVEKLLKKPKKASAPLKW